MLEGVLEDPQHAASPPQSIADLIVEIVSDDSRAGDIVQFTAERGVERVDLTPTPT